MNRSERRAAVLPTETSDYLDKSVQSTFEFEGLVAELWSKVARFPTATVSSLGTELDPPADAIAAGGPPVHFGRFLVREVLGRGGGGIVLLAHDATLDRDVALKVPSPTALGSRAARARFVREGRAVSRLDHPQVVRVFEADDCDSIPFIVMEYCPEGSLARWLAQLPRERWPSPAWSARLVAGIAEAIEHAHSKKIIHRDLKPSNILLAPAPASTDRDEGPALIGKVADFGLAKNLAEEITRQDRTVQGHPLGTLPYMAPEAARGDGRAMGPGTDVYGLGAILFELLTGQPPGNLEDRDDLLGLGPDRPPVETSPGSRPTPPSQLATICARCLESSPEDRYRSAGEVADDLRRYLEGVPIRARSRSFVDRALLWPIRHPTLASLAGLALVAGATAAAVAVKVSAWIRAQDAQYTLRQFEASEVASLPGLIERLDTRDPAVLGRLERLSVQGTPHQKLASTLARSGIDPASRERSYENLLRAEPRAIVPIALALRGRYDGLADRLAVDAAAPTPTGATISASEAHDRRRAVAAIALLALGRDQAAWSLLRHVPDPQARSFLIHLLGPSGIDPARLALRLDREADPSVRLALLQSFGEMDREAWDPRFRDRMRDRVLEIYEKADHAGVHASAKWLAIRWGLADRLAAIDRKLVDGPAPGPERAWRIGPFGITFVRIRDEKAGRTIEVSDTEITVEQFLCFRPQVEYARQISPDPDSPINSLDSVDAAQFCLRLTSVDGIPSTEIAYKHSDEVLLAPVDDQLDRAGYRLLTDREFLVASLAGATTSRYYGGANSLLRQYAWCEIHSDIRASQVARHKPNDFGLFDTLGNMLEICRTTNPAASIQNQTALCGGAYVSPEHKVYCAAKYDETSTRVRGLLDRNGFRVARTVVAR